MKPRSIPLDRKPRYSRSIYRIALLLLALYTPVALAQSTFTINSLDDDGDLNTGDGTCDTGTMLPLGSECTLRAAIQEANADPDHVILEFHPDLPVDTFGRSIIQPFSLLPAVQSRLTIDGATHAEYVDGSGEPRVVLRYSATGAPGASGLLFTSDSSLSTVRALAIEAFPNSGIVLLGGNGFTIEQCSIGLAWGPQTISSLGNGQFGIVVDGASSSGGGATVIRDNVIAYNGTSGILITGGAETTFVQDNVIGLRPPTGAGSAFLPTPAAGNGEYGIHIAAMAGPGNVIGGFGSNTISNNVEGEVLIEADGQVMSNNLLGLPHDFLVPPNFDIQDYGQASIALDIDSSDNTIGGNGNINHIGNASSFNIRVGRFGDAVSNNYIGHVRVGITPDGQDTGADNIGINVFRSNNTVIDSAIIANSSVANIAIVSGSGHQVIGSRLSGPGINGMTISGLVTVGGSTDDANVIGGSDRGILVQSPGPGLVEISHNFIGTDESGNGFGNGMGVLVSGPDNTVDIVNNTIAFNDVGVQLDSGSTDTWVQGNVIGVAPGNEPGPNGIGVLVRTSDDNTQGHLIGHAATDPIPPSGPLLGNFIAHSEEAAVQLHAPDGSSVLEHSIRGNTMIGNAQGIDLGLGGDVIDPGDADEGANRLQNFPEFDVQATNLNTVANEIEYRFRVPSAPSNAAYPLRVDFYRANDGSAQGDIYLGTVTYSSADAQQWVDGSFTPNLGVSPSASLVATATDSQGNTSQFTPQPIPLILADEIFADSFIQ